MRERLARRGGARRPAPSPGPDRPWTSRTALHVEQELLTAAEPPWSQAPPSLTARTAAATCWPDASTTGRPGSTPSTCAGAAFARALVLGSAPGDVPAEAAACTLAAAPAPTRAPPPADALALAPDPAVGPAVAPASSTTPRPDVCAAALAALRFPAARPRTGRWCSSSPTPTGPWRRRRRAAWARWRSGRRRRPCCATSARARPASTRWRSPAARRPSSSPSAIGAGPRVRAGPARGRERGALPLRRRARRLPAPPRPRRRRRRSRALLPLPSSPARATPAAVGWFGHPDRFPGRLAARSSLEAANDARRSAAAPALAPSAFEVAAARALQRILPATPAPPPALLPVAPPTGSPSTAAAPGGAPLLDAKARTRRLAAEPEAPLRQEPYTPAATLRRKLSAEDPLRHPRRRRPSSWPSASRGASLLGDRRPGVARQRATLSPQPAARRWLPTRYAEGAYLGARLDPALSDRLLPLRRGLAVERWRASEYPPSAASRPGPPSAPPHYGGTPPHRPFPCRASTSARAFWLRHTLHLPRRSRGPFPPSACVVASSACCNSGA